MADVIFAGKEGGKVTVDSAAIDALKAGLRGELVTPSDANYDEVRAIWNGMIDKRPRLIVRPRGTADVIAAVNFARDNNVLLAMRGGGHNVAGNSTCDDGLMIDFGLMRGVQVDPVTNIVHAEAGARLGDLDTETQAYGLAVPAGVVSDTGAAGLTLGGGTGWQTRKRGLTIDNLRSVNIVTADGQARFASKTENPDLFWALRGGGGNFGVVTSFEYQAYPVGPQIWICAPFYPYEMAGDVTKAFTEFMAEAPAEFGSALIYWSVPANPHFPAEHHGKPTVIPFIVYIGDVKVGDELTKPLRSLGEPLCDHSRVDTWCALQTMFDPFVPPHTLKYYWKNLYLKNVDDDVADALVEIGRTIPSRHTYLVLQPLAGALNEVPADETAFGARDINYMFEFDSMWETDAETDENVAWTRKSHASLEPYSTGRFYINFPGLGEMEDESLLAAVGADAYARLGEVKAKYDPENLFRLNQNVKPAARK